MKEEDTLLFFKRIVAKLHGVNLNKEFTNPKKKQENTVKAITGGEATPAKGSGKSKGRKRKREWSFSDPSAII